MQTNTHAKNNANTGEEEEGGEKKMRAHNWKAYHEFIAIVLKANVFIPSASRWINVENTHISHLTAE